MKFTVQAHFEKRPKADLLVLPYWKTKKGPEPVGEWKSLASIVRLPLENKDFEAEHGQCSLVYVDGKKEPRILLVGLGEEDNPEMLRRAGAIAARFALQHKLGTLNVVLPKNAVAFAEGVLLVNYSFDALKKEKKPTPLLSQVTWIGGVSAELNKVHVLCESVYLTRDMVNQNADESSPQHIAKAAQKLAKEFSGISCFVMGLAQLEKEKMGLLLAVGRGSSVDPALITLQYNGNPQSKDVTALIGKGVSFDTGGLCMKSRGSIETMKLDMAGAATVLGVLRAVATLKLKCNLVVIIPATENSVGPKSYKPGDVYVGHSGKSVEVGNTDAEGRLILADAISYANKKFKPTRMVTIATLTGAIIVALGEETVGLMSNSDELCGVMTQAGNATYERVWRLPLFKEYLEQLKSDFADLNNMGGPQAGSITAACFLQEFVGKTPWCHLDVAGTAYMSTQRRYHPKYATGIGVRLLTKFLELL